MDVMKTVSRTEKRTAKPKPEKISDLLHQLGDIPYTRLRLSPRFGNARESDVVELLERENIPCELVDGYLVEKVMSHPESCLASNLITDLTNFLRGKRLGVVSGEAGLMRILPKVIRIPDVAFVSYGRLPGKKYPSDAISPVAPNLAVEILSKGNSKAEMARKRKEYFSSGVELYWEIDPKKRIVDVYTAEDQMDRLISSDTLTGGTVLPGFKLPLATFFAYMDEGV